LLLDGKEVVELRSDGRQIQVSRCRPVAEPLCVTSSGLGDHRVEGPRQRLFAEFCHRPVDLARQQDAFHRHRWPERPHLSVCMVRADARTVSHTVVSLGPDRVTLAYHPEAPDQPAENVSVTIPLADGGIA
jgi:hypothetical protein